MIVLNSIKVPLQRGGPWQFPSLQLSTALTIVDIMVCTTCLLPLPLRRSSNYYANLMALKQYFKSKHVVF